MEFVNHTGFPAQDFGGIDQHAQQFHVIVLRQTLEWDDCAQLRYGERQEPLCESDDYFGEYHNSSVRQESDYCHFKPKCDVLVNATAHAPGGAPAASFPVRLQVRLPDRNLSTPPLPQGLNQFMNPSPEAMKRWRESLPTAPAHGDVLVDKTLRIHGPRSFRRRSAPVRAVAAIARVATLGTVRMASWMLTRPRTALTVPLRQEYAFGGECRISADTPPAQRVPAKHHITDEQSRALADLDAQFQRKTVAYAAFVANPLGRGFAVPWFLKAHALRAVPAPQIEWPDRPVTVADFRACLQGQERPDIVSRLCGGFGVRPKSHPERMRLSGTIDDSFVQSDKWLPDDFDFAVWNAAAPDQQTPFLKGGEIIELTNMCAAGTPGAVTDAAGNTVLTLTLPENECYLVIRLESGEIFTHAMAIDTVIAEPDERRMSIVWRTVLARDDEAVVRVAEAMCRTHAERDREREEIERYKAAFDLVASENGDAP